jgi:hypothetical protein
VGRFPATQVLRSAAITHLDDDVVEHRMGRSEGEEVCDRDPVEKSPAIRTGTK